MSRDDPHFRLRVPGDLKEQIEAAAKRNKRSMNAEVVSRLEHSFAIEREWEEEIARGDPIDDPLTRRLEEAVHTTIRQVLKEFGVPAIDASELVNMDRGQRGPEGS